eukprot:TRINITY_DN3876_c0_g1_i2.p1 TRINITY_DN3876_c0_g1~~TRINITY_DN3876_c0_g1_i2.p1  ORF type:complete len:291 (+),score=71.37 TRINITY_DN3876_c0_g1_i2:507-1379(+)
MSKNITSAKTTLDVGNLVVEALAHAHHAIISPKPDIWMAGTTTLLGGMCIEVEKKKSEEDEEDDEGSDDDDENNSDWYFLAIAVGDCKALHWSKRNKCITDLTEGNRMNLTDARDPGGRIGPYLKSGEPDLRNLRIVFSKIQSDDLILILSDGAHDNLDPQTLGKSPKDVGLKDVESWDDVDLDKGTKIKTKYMNDLITKIIFEKNKLLTPKQISKKIIEYCMNITEASRHHMEQNPNLALEDDYQRFPGKMDHTTCIAFKVGHFDPDQSRKEDEEGGVKESINPDIWPF